MKPWKTALFLSLSLVAAPARLAAQQHEPAPQHAPVYDEKADAAADVAAATARAAKENRRVLVVWGANWCGWCVKLHDLFGTDEKIARKLLYEYDVVSVDVGHFDKNMELAQKLGASFKGIPFLTVLDGKGAALVQQDTGALENGPAHDPARVLAFLEKFQASYEKATDVRDRALKSAAESKKTVLLTFGAPWCPWCHRFEDWMARKDVADLLAKNFVIQKVDVDRTIGGKELLASYGGGESGIPWFVFLDGTGKALANSGTGNDNLGCPASPAEIATFGTLLKKAAPSLSAEDWSALERSLNARREEQDGKKKAS